MQTEAALERFTRYQKLERSQHNRRLQPLTLGATSPRCCAGIRLQDDRWRSGETLACPEQHGADPVWRKGFERLELCDTFFISWATEKSMRMKGASISRPSGLQKPGAHVIAAELRADDPAYQSLVAVRVDDERGNEVARVPITDGKA